MIWDRDDFNKFTAEYIDIVLENAESFWPTIDHSDITMEVVHSLPEGEASILDGKTIKLHAELFAADYAGKFALVEAQNIEYIYRELAHVVARHEPQAIYRELSPGYLKALTDAWMDQYPHLWVSVEALQEMITRDLKTAMELLNKSYTRTAPVKIHQYLINNGILPADKTFAPVMKNAN